MNAGHMVRPGDTVPVRVAVQVGGTTVRVATAGGVAELLAELPGGIVRGPVDVAELLVSLVGPAPREVVLVHPAGWPADRVAAWPGHPVPAPVAAAGRVRRIVVEAKRSGTDVTLVHGGKVVVHRRCPVGGAALDAAVAPWVGGDLARARQVREMLSLQPVSGELDAERLRAVLAPLLRPIADLVQAVHEAGAAPVLLLGGLARCPLLAEVLDAAGLPDVEVASRPEAAAVRGALVFPIVNGRDHAGRPVPPAVAPATEATRWLPVPPAAPRRPARLVAGSLLAAVVAAALLAVGSLLPPRADAAAVPVGVLVQYGYRFDLPAGWEHGGGLPERRRSLLRPAAVPEGSDLIAVERTLLGYDTAAEPERARAELRATFDAAVSAGSALSGYGPAAVAGRTVTSYRQADGASTVDWFVVLDGDSQLSVGCRHTAAGERAVLAACAVVVGSVRRA
jgi:type VII secretion-associated protein (TIGR03931 family)